MTVTIEPARLAGEVHVPPSKSIAQRACAAALLHRGTTEIRNFGPSSDEQAARSLIRECGAAVRDRDAGTLLVSSPGIQQAPGSVHCGESGLAARLFTPILALYREPVRILAAGSLLQRPMDLFGQVLPQLGVEVESNNGHMPLTVRGPLQAKDIVLDGSLSSQFITGLLFALSEAAAAPLTVTVRDAVSLPYLALTLQALKTIGRPIAATADFSTFHIDPALFQPPLQATFVVEPDWSSAVVWLAAACMGHQLYLKGLQPGSLQADTAMLDVIDQVGAGIQWKSHGLLLAPPVVLQPFYCDITQAPDLFPVLAVLAGACQGESRITGLHRLKHKESDRVHSTAALLQQLDVPFHITAHTIYISGVPSFRACTVDSFNDHRLVMAATLAACHSKGPIQVQGAEAVRKSYPDFFDHWEQAGGVVKGRPGPV